VSHAVTDAARAAGHHHGALRVIPAWHGEPFCAENPIPEPSGRDVTVAQDSQQLGDTAVRQF
jgi:hypothetical protein